MTKIKSNFIIFLQWEENERGFSGHSKEIILLEDEDISAYEVESLTNSQDEVYSSTDHIDFDKVIVARATKSLKFSQKATDWLNQYEKLVSVIGVIKSRRGETRTQVVEAVEALGKFTNRILLDLGMGCDSENHNRKIEEGGYEKFITVAKENSGINADYTYSW